MKRIHALSGIAIIGMAGRFPQSPNLDAFWDMLKNGREAVQTFTDQELLDAGVEPKLLQHPDYVKSGMVVPDIEYFDAAFFGMNPVDAEITDPQQRMFLECAYQALEQAGYPPTTTAALIGLYAGAGENNYLTHCLAPHMAELLSKVGGYRLHLLNGKDFISSRTAYKLNLRGPSVTVQTACSSSLTAVHMACQSLLNFECDIALAGGVSVFLPQGVGYRYQEGMIMSPDGHCRAFDAAAAGTAGGGGVGLVVLKRLAEALEDRDTIHAVIRGSAINNDGADKVGFTAPSVGGQSAVILEAQTAAGVHPEDISYIEAHGTGTPLGDPIEVQALTQAFRSATSLTGYCAIGSVKTNIGHADAAAGVAGLIKTVLALKHKTIPASLHFERPNPQIDFAGSPFFVNAERHPWETLGGKPRCAGVSSFGIGGTNAHVIVQEAPDPAADPHPIRNLQLLLLSAKTAAALEAASDNLQAHLANHPEQPLADVAYTLSRCRQAFSHRRMLVCSDHGDARLQLAKANSQAKHTTDGTTPKIAFLLPGQGSQYVGMTHELYATEAVFSDVVDQCAELVLPHLGKDIRDILYHNDGQADINQTGLAQPILFVVEYALAKLWMAWGIQPDMLLGHSIGEYVAACLSGVLNLEDALSLVALRGSLIQALPPGDMLAVPLSAADAQSWCSAEISLAAVNGPARCVLSGSPSAIARLQTDLHGQGIEGIRLHTSHAFHSHLLEPVLEPFAKHLRQVKFHPPRIPYLSNLSGDWIGPDEATSPDYWVKHLRHTVCFAGNLEQLFVHGAKVLLEVGPGRVLSSLAKQHPACPVDCVTLPSLPVHRETSPPAETRQLLHSLGQLWLQGAPVDWDGFYADERHCRVPLPTYPFERKRHWLDPAQPARQAWHALHSNREPETHCPTAATPAVSPSIASTPLEQQVAALWAQSLGIQDMDVDADFFALGGDSLLATQMVVRLNDCFSVSLDTHSLLQAPTIAKLARLIGDRLDTGQAGVSGSPIDLPELLVPIRPGQPDRNPLVLLYPVGGHVYFYRDLARHLDPRLPVYAIRAQGSEGEAPLLTTIEAMAEVSLQALRAFQKHGPYYLAGSSFGGILAYAMAQKLVAEGEKIGFLGLIDSPGPGHMPAALADKAEIMFYMLKVGENAELSLEDLRTLGEEQQLGCFLKLSQQEDTPAARAALKRMLDLFQANLQAMLDYTPLSYPNKLHFFLARERDEFNARTPAQAWIPLAEGGIEIFTIPGNHISMNTAPNVRYLADCLQKCLNQAAL
ncbi:MAG: type I polyketide synthase [Candidatus Methylumidiphilus sp.]